MLRLKSKHRIKCGDSTSEADVADLMAGEKADMVFTDPPYPLTGGGPRGSWGKGLSGGFWDNSEFKDKGRSNLFEMPEFKDWIKTFSNIMENNHEIFIMSNVRNIKDLMDEILLVKYKYHNILVMVKNMGFPHFWYTTNTEFILYFYKGKAIEPTNRCRPNYFNVEMPKGDGKFHVSQKPISMISEIIENHPFKKVYEPFLGSGSTLIACEKTERRCYGMEIDTKYMNVILKRYSDYCGGSIVKA